MTKRIAVEQRHKLRKHIKAALTGAVVLGTGLFALPSNAATYTVTSTADSGPGTLRQAIIDANANPGADTIVLDGTLGANPTFNFSSILPALADDTQVVIGINGATLSNSDLRADGLGTGIGYAGEFDLTNTTISGNLIANGSATNVANRGVISLTASNVTGNATANNYGEINLDNTALTGNVFANNDSSIDIENGSLVTGNVTANDDSYVHTHDSRVTGDVTAKDSASIDIDTNSIVNGNVIADGWDAEVYIDDSTVDNNITANDGGLVSVHNSLIKGNAIADGDSSQINIHDGTTVNGNASAINDGYLDIGWNSTVKGNVVGDGDDSYIDIHNNSIVGNVISGVLQAGTGDLTSVNGAEIDVDSSAIQGNVFSGAPSSDGDESHVHLTNSIVGTLNGGVLQSGTGNVNATNGGYVDIDSSNVYGNVNADGTDASGDPSNVTIDNSFIGTLSGTGVLQNGTGDVSATNGGSVGIKNASVVYGNVSADGQDSDGAPSLVDIYSSTIGTLDSAGVLQNGTGNVSVTNGGSVYIEGISRVYGNVSASDDSSVYLDSSTIGKLESVTLITQTGTGNLTAGGTSTVRVDGDSSTYGNVAFNDSSVLYLDNNNNGFNNLLATTNTGTTSFNDTSTFVPNVQNAHVSVNALSIAPTTRLRPYFNYSFLNSGVDISTDNGVTHSYSVLDYQTRSGEFGTVISPLDVGVYYGPTTTPGDVRIYLNSNTVDFNRPGITGSDNQRSFGRFLSDYVTHYQGLNGAPVNQFSLAGLPTFGSGNIAEGLLNSYAIAAYLDDVTQGGNLDGLGWETANFEAFSHLNSQAYWNQKSLVDSILNNLSNAGDVSGSNPAAFALNFSNTNNPQAQLASLSRAMTPAYGVLSANGNNGYATNSGIWATYNGSRQKTKADSGIGSNDWDSTTNGVTVGYTNGGERFSWGAAVGYQRSNLSFSDIGASGKQDGWNGGIYGSLKNKNLYLTGILGYGRYSNDTHGVFATDTTSSKNKATSIALEVGRQLKKDGKGGLSPYASVLWANVKQDSTEVGGAGSGVVLDSGTNNTFTTELGLRYNRRLFDKSGALKGGWQGGLAWLHQGGDTGMESKFSFYDNTNVPLPVSGFGIKGTQLAGDSLVVRLGAYGRIHNNVIGFAGYQGTFGSNQKINAVNAGVGYQF